MLVEYFYSLLNIIKYKNQIIYSSQKLLINKVKYNYNLLDNFIRKEILSSSSPYNPQVISYRLVDALTIKK